MVHGLILSSFENVSREVAFLSGGHSSSRADWAALGEAGRAADLRRFK